ncbi:ComF family protein [Roseateles saccharophilus]|uniref:ComF family protein n=1 Tax=Roseateles saccharophilus TaxID=304 RepID=A0A4R3V5E1_ROSSA|nr:ComF family protein [Roseateles saccharophilus]MDG0833723.1 ComF family protein [Roseateles saccharophilus]TCU98802.1 ComF family protein [Roseateles saccharophilus]
MPERSLAAAKPALVEKVLMRCTGQCSVCRSWSHRTICESCLGLYARPQPRCWTCAARLPPELMGRPQPQCGRCLTEPPPLDRAVAALDYRFPWDGLLQHFKYHQALDLRESLLERLNSALNAAEVVEPDWLLPVPLSPGRLRERGYNQSHELAKALARRRGLRCEPEMLLRVRQNAAQAGLKLEARAANVRGVFAVEPLRAGVLRGSNVALLDDVMTSGATLFELARVLLQAGVMSVQAWVIARTPAPDED